MFSWNYWVKYYPDYLIDFFTLFYLADFGAESSKYLRVKPQTALALLDKINEANKKNVFDNMFNKKDRDKKKLVDTIYKQLKMKMAAPGSSIANDWRKISQSYYLTPKKLMAYFFTSFIRERVPPKIFFSWSKYFGLENTSYCLYLWWIVILWKNSIFSLLNNKWILLNTLLSNFRIQKKIVWKYFNEKQLLEFLLNSYTKFTRLLELEVHNPLAFRQPRQW